MIYFSSKISFSFSSLANYRVLICSVYASEGSATSTDKISMSFSSFGTEAKPEISCF
jgi:hypothetical protein